MEELAYIDIKKYKIGGKGLRHLEHVFRVKTQRELSGDIRVYGDTFDDLKVSYARSKKVENLYLEVMVSGATEKTQEIMQMLREKFKGHKVCAVEHYDEAKPHCHFLISWANPDSGKTIRLKLMDLGEHGSIAQDIVKITRQRVTPKGQGRKRISLREYEVDPDTVRKKIEVMKIRDAKALGFIKKMIELYGPITLTAISDKGRIDLQTVRSVDEVNLKRLRVLESKGEGIYFYPSTVEVKAIFIDDVPPSRVKDLPREALIVKTSDNKYQAHIPYAYTKETKEIGLHQKVAVRVYDSDRGASAIQQPRRLAYFKNHKYSHKPEVVEVNIEGRTSTSKDLYDKVKEYILKTNQITPIRRRLESSNIARGIKVWSDFYDGDESVADARYAYHLMLNGFSDEEIKNKLKIESQFLEIRKKGHVEDYLTRTLNKVRDFYDSRVRKGGETYGLGRGCTRKMAQD